MAEVGGDRRLRYATPEKPDAPATGRAIACLGTCSGRRLARLAAQPASEHTATVIKRNSVSSKTGGLARAIGSAGRVPQRPASLPDESGNGPSDRTIAALLVAREPRAMELVYDRWGHLTYAIALTILGDRAEAEDVVLAAHLKLWRQPESALLLHESLQTFLNDAVSRDAHQRLLATA